MELYMADFVVLAVYFAVVVGVGVWAGRQNRDTDDYFVGGRSMPGWVVGVSILGTCISSVTYVAYPGMAFARDWQYLVQGLMLPLVLTAGGYLVVKFYRLHVKTSVNEFLEERFNPGVRVFSFIFLLSSEIARVAMVMYLFSLVVNTITGVDIVKVILAIGAVTIVYAVVGGIKGVIWTDLIQSAVLFAGGALTVAVVAARLPGGFSQIVDTGLSSSKFDLFDFEPTMARDAFWVLAVSGIVNYFYFLAGNQNQIQRYQCPATDREALKATMIGSLLSVPAWALFMLVGTSLFVYYQQFPDAEVAAFALADKPDKVFPHFIATGLPAGVSGLLLAGLVAAAMSSLDSSLNASSTLFVTDIYKRFIKPDAEEGYTFNLARVLTFVWGVIGVLLALAMIRVGVFLEFYFKIVSLVIGAITGVFFLALLTRRAHGRGVIVGILAGVPVMVWGSADMLGIGWMPAFPWHGIMVGVLTTAVVIVAGYTASLVIPDSRP